MKTRKSSSRLLVLMVLICCYHEICAGVVKPGKPKNSTTVQKEIIPTFKHSKVTQKAKAISTTTTTLKPEVGTDKPTELDLDGRSAFINNQFVADEGSAVENNSPQLYEISQQQMETVLSNTAKNVEIYDDKQKPPGKPLFSFDVAQFDEYDEQDTGGEYGTDPEDQPENCEDTEESLTDTEDATNYGETPSQPNTSNPEVLQNNYGQSVSAETPQNNIYDSSHYASHTNLNQESSYNNYGQTTKPIQNSKSPQSAYGQSKPFIGTKQQTPQSNYGQSKPLEQHSPAKQSTQSNYGQSKPLEQQQNNSNQKPLITQNYFDKLKPQRNSSKFPQHSQKQVPNDGNKPSQTYNKVINNVNSNAASPSPPNLSYSNSNPTALSSSNPSYSSSNTATLNPSYGIPSSPLSQKPSYPSPTYQNSDPSSSNTSFGNLNPASSSPFSSNNKHKHHLTFRTVSSSTQFVSTPLADLMFKFSIGMAKHSSAAKGNNNHAPVYNINDLVK